MNNVCVVLCADFLISMTFDEHVKLLNKVGEKFEKDVAEIRQQGLGKESKTVRKYAN